MTIAKRLSVLIAIPVVIILGLGVLSFRQLARIEERSRSLAEPEDRRLLVEFRNALRAWMEQALRTLALSEQARRRIIRLITERSSTSG